MLDSNPANGGTFTFADANALSNLPYLTKLRVAHDGHESLLPKRDTGYGQGPGQFIANGQPYRLDVWWQAAQPLGITKSPVKVQLAPATGAAPTLGALPGSSEASGGGEASAGPVRRPKARAAFRCRSRRARRRRSCRAAWPPPAKKRPAAVKRMVAAGNRLFGASYLYGGAHGTSLRHAAAGV